MGNRSGFAISEMIIAGPKQFGFKFRAFEFKDLTHIFPTKK